MNRLVKCVCVGVVLFGLSACGQKDSKEQESVSKASNTESAENVASTKGENKKVPVIVLGQELGVSSSADLSKIGCKISKGMPYKNKDIPNPPKEWITYSLEESYYENGKRRYCQGLKDIGFEQAEFTYDGDKLVRIEIAEGTSALARVMSRGLQPSFERFAKLSKILEEKYNEIKRGEGYALFDNGGEITIALGMDKLILIAYELNSFYAQRQALQNEFKQQKENALKGGL